MNPKLLVTALFLSAASSASAVMPYAEASVGYLIDTEKALLAARLGCEVANTNQISHQVEVEVARTTDSDFGFKLSLVPIMANYRVTGPMGAMSDFFVGAGAGVTRAKISGLGLSDSDNPFTIQIFTGVAYKMTPRVALTGAVRYLRIEKGEFFGIKDKIGDDFSLEGGVRFRF